MISARRNRVLYTTDQEIQPEDTHILDAYTLINRSTVAHNRLILQRFLLDDRIWSWRKSCSLFFLSSSNYFLNIYIFFDVYSTRKKVNWEAIVPGIQKLIDIPLFSLYFVVCRSRCQRALQHFISTYGLSWSLVSRANFCLFRKS